jgi:predicted DCC family thiol-disulfide oxidoreductase YuxK
MVEDKPKALMLFDGNCGICTFFAEFATRFDVKQRFEIVPYQKIPEEKLNPYRITHRDCGKKMQVVTPQGRVYSGAFGMNYFFFNYPPWSLLIVLFYALPIFLLAEIIVYWLVARNREKLSRWFGLNACLRD